MDLAVTLVKSVMRAFYATREILVIDALILHETLRDDDLAYLMSINTKDLHKICGKLREDRLLTVHTRAELREGNPRPSNRTWYYINYRHTIDAIKWRVYTINQNIQGTTVPADEKKEYFCPHCKSGWTEMEVLDSWSPEGFLCHRCGTVLKYEADRNAGGHEKSTRLNHQFRFISELLPKIDSVKIPECDFDRAFAKARPVLRDATHMRAATTAADPGASRPMAVKGLSNLGPQSIAVNISTSDGPSEAELEAERARKEQIAKQNELPAWMSQSTVTGESFGGAASGVTAAATGPAAGDSKDRSGANGAENESNAQLQDIFAKIKAEQEAERRREIEEENESSSGEEVEEDEDDMDFEDVKREDANEDKTPSIKREISEAVSMEDSSEDRPVKKVKVEPEVKKEPGQSDQAADDDDDDDDDDEDAQFEDV